MPSLKAKASEVLQFAGQSMTIQWIETARKDMTPAEAYSEGWTAGYAAALMNEPTVIGEAYKKETGKEKDGFLEGVSEGETEE